MRNAWPYLTPGIPDELFTRGQVPMTKEEIRTVTLAKARLGPGQVVWDVGSGTGSLAIEAARLGPDLTVYAVERSPEGIALLHRNVKQFGTTNVKIIPGEAPAVLTGLPAPHRVLVGGSGGRLAEILDVVQEKLLPDGRVVVNAITLETVNAALTFLSRPSWRAEIIQMAVSRAVLAGERHLLLALNPVFIISAAREGKQNDR